MRSIITLITAVFIFISSTIAQQLQPGFDVKEYTTLLALGFFANGNPVKAPAEPYTLVYKSPEMGLKNLWWLYTHDKEAAILIRGTVGEKESWLENYYCPMVPATGDLQLDAGSAPFHYKLAESKEAYTHAGWTIGMAFLVRDMLPQIKKLYASGIKEFVILGHSQGGVLACLVSSYFYYAQKAGELPADMHFKTYASAAPKPGNMQYAYDYDFIHKGGWAYTVVNAADWVPETPYSIQRTTDMNHLNPIIHIPEALKKQKFFLRLIGKYYYGKLDRKTRKAQEKYTQILGHKLFQLAIKKSLPGLEEPSYVPSMSYMRAGTPIILMPDAEYYSKFGLDKADKFAHHHFEPYRFLAEKQYGSDIRQ